MSKLYLDKLTLQKCEEWAFEWPENTYVAIDNGNVIGFMCCFGHGEEEPDAGEINAIYVLSEYYGYRRGTKAHGYRFGRKIGACHREHTSADKGKNKGKISR